MGQCWSYADLSDSHFDLQVLVRGYLKDVLLVRGLHTILSLRPIVIVYMYVYWAQGPGAVVESVAGLFIIVRIERSVVSGQRSSVDGRDIDQVSWN